MAKDPQSEILKTLKSIDQKLAAIEKNTNPRAAAREHEREKMRVEQARRDGERMTFGETGEA